MAFGDDIRIGIDVDGATSAAGDLRRVGDAADDVGGRAGRFGDAWKTAGALATGAIAGAAVSMVLELGNIGLELDTMGRRVDTIFGDSADDARVWAEELNRAFGTSAERVAGMAANVADLLVPMGATREEALLMSQDTIELASALDLWSTATGSTSEATDILTKAMLGERDGLAALGIKVTQAQIDAELLKNNQQDLEGSARQLAEAQALVTIVTQQSGDAIAFAGSEAAENQYKIRDLKARWAELKDELALQLLPKLYEAADALLVVSDWVESEGIPAAQKMWTDWGQPIVSNLGAVVQAAAGAVAAFDAVNTAISNISPLPDLNLPGWASATIAYATDGPRGAAGSIAKSIAGNSRPTASSTYQGSGMAWYEVPRRAMGGTVPASTGGTLARIGEAGEDEEIMPVAQRQGLYGPQGGAGVTVGAVNVTVGPGGDPAAVGQAVVDALQFYERRNGAGWRN